MTSFSASWLHLFWLLLLQLWFKLSYLAMYLPSPERAVTGWMASDVDWLYISINKPPIDFFTPFTHRHTHPFNGPFLGLPGWAGTRNLKSVWIFLKQETMSGSQLGYMQVCTLLQTTTPAPHRSVFYRPDALPAAQPTASKHSFHYIHVSFMLRIALTTVRCSIFCCVPRPAIPAMQPNTMTVYTTTTTI